VNLPFIPKIKYLQMAFTYPNLPTSKLVRSIYILYTWQIYTDIYTVPFWGYLCNNY